MDGGETTDELMVLFYAAVTSVQDGVGEIEVQRSIEDRDTGTVTTVTVYVRREPLQITLPAADG